MSDQQIVEDLARKISEDVLGSVIRGMKLLMDVVTDEEILNGGLMRLCMEATGTGAQTLSELLSADDALSKITREDAMAMCLLSVCRENEQVATGIRYHQAQSLVSMIKRMSS